MIKTQKSYREEKVTNTKRERTIHIEIGKNNRRKRMKERNIEKGKKKQTRLKHPYEERVRNIPKRTYKEEIKR